MLIALTSVLTFSALFDTKKISQNENRTLQEFPELSVETYLKGSYFRDLENYFYDHFPLRTKILKLAKIFDKIKGIEPEVMAINGGENKSLVNVDENEKMAERRKNKLAEKSKKDEKKNEEAGTKKEKIDLTKLKTQTQNINVMATKDRIMELFHFDDEMIAYYTEVLAEFAEKMPSSIRMYSLLSPTQVGLTDGKYKDYNDPQDLGIEYIYSQLDKRYTGVNVFQALYEKKDEYLYFRSDHHWTQLGAYYAAKEFAKVAGVDFTDIEKYKKTRIDGFLGSLYHNNPLEKLEENPDSIEIYYLSEDIPSLKALNYDANTGELVESVRYVVNFDVPSYSTFMGGDSAILTYENPKPTNGRRLMIIKDSYANAFITWLIPSFDKIVVLDPRYFGANIYELAKKEEITDFLVLDYVLAATMGAYIDQLAIVSGLIE